MVPPVTLFSVTAIVLLDNTGERILAKYFTAPHPPAGTPPPLSVKEQKNFESGLFQKTAKQSTVCIVIVIPASSNTHCFQDVVLYDNKIVVFKSESDGKNLPAITIVLANLDSYSLRGWQRRRK
jgi:hypothetical protein